jgi:CDP-glucose 4,6-dehydratase
VLRVRRADAVRPWQHVLDPLAGYLRLAEALWRDPALAGAYNFGPSTDAAATVGDVVRLARAAYGSGEWRDETDPAAPHEAGRLALEVARAREVLGVAARWPLAEAIFRTMRWHRRVGEGASAAAQCVEDLDAFERDAAVAPGHDAP